MKGLRPMREIGRQEAARQQEYIPCFRALRRDEKPMCKILAIGLDSDFGGLERPITGYTVDTLHSSHT